MNRASLDRGFGRCIVLKKYGAVLKRYPNRARDRIVAPTPSSESLMPATKPAAAASRLPRPCCSCHRTVVRAPLRQRLGQQGEGTVQRGGSRRRHTAKPY